jgi:hypothetical protein
MAEVDVQRCAQMLIDLGRWYCAGALLVDNELQLLPREVAYSRINGVCNLSSEAGNLGTFYITNIRVVWFSNASNAFNVSIPYVQVSPASPQWRPWHTCSCSIH